MEFPVSLARKTFAAMGVSAVALLTVGSATPALAAGAASGGFADANGIIVRLTVLTAVPVPGALGNTPLDPNTFSNASQSCPPTAAKDSADSLLNVPAAPAATADAVDTLASSKCSATAAVSSAAAQTVGLKALFQGEVPTITADVIRAQANSDCTKAPNAAGSQFVGLTIAGQAIPEIVAPNTTIPLPGIGSVIVNEQHPTANGRGIVVNGLHVIGASPLLRGDLIISHATSGVVCTGGGGAGGAAGPGSDFSGVPGARPEITFGKDANPSTAHAGDTVTYTATVTNRSTADCDVLRFVDHLDPVFDYGSTAGGFGTTVTTPVPKRIDGGVDVVVVPSGVVLGAGKSLTQTFVVKLKGSAAPGTYYNNLELFCAVNGDYASGPLAPVTVPAAVVAPAAAPDAGTAAAPAAAPEQLPRTGSASYVAASALLFLIGAAGIHRATR
jgi:uncharacterized repeat protein (TIGR01451 family)